MLYASETDSLEFRVLREKKKRFTVNFPSEKMDPEQGFANRGTLARAVEVKDVSLLLASALELALHSVDGTSEQL